MSTKGKQPPLPGDPDYEAYFSRLKDKWYKKLSDDGFKDIEKDNRLIRTAQDEAYKTTSELERETKIDYFDQLSSFVYNEDFKDPSHKLIMEKFSDGVKIKDIAQQLKPVRKRKNNKYIERHTVTRIIKEYENKWKIKLLIKQSPKPPIPS